MENRDSTKFLAATLPERTNADPRLTLEDVFIFQGSFNLYAENLNVIYNDYQFAEDFENWKKPLNIFKKVYTRNGGAQIGYQAFYSQASTFEDHPALQAVLQSLGLTELNHATVLDAAIERARAICNAPADADFVHLLVSPEAFELSARFDLPSGEIFPFVRRGENYNQHIQANMDVVMPCLLLGHAMAIRDDAEFWEGANWILPE